LQSLYLFFPQQGIAIATYLYNDEIVPPHEHLPVMMMIFQSSPQSDSVGVIQSAFTSWDTSTYDDWIADLQPWQGVEQLSITER